MVMKKWFVVLLLFCFGTFFPIHAQVITTIAGGATGHGGYWGEGGPATAAEIDYPCCIAIDSFNNLYVSSSNRILKVDAITGTVTTFAGTGGTGFSGDGKAATTAQTGGGCLAFDVSGNLYITDVNNYRVRKVDKNTGIISTFAGNGGTGSTGDGGPATAAQIEVAGITCDRFGNVYLGDYDKLRKVDAAGYISTVAGNGMTGVTVDGMPATATALGNPIGICTDTSGNVYVCDSTLSLRKIDVNTGIISRVAGTGDNTGTPYSGDGTVATACHLIPFDVKVDWKGNIYLAGIGNNRAYMIDTMGLTHSIAGTGVSGYSGDNGPATAAKVYQPHTIAIDACGDVYFADFANSRVRKITYPPVLIRPSVTITGMTKQQPGMTVTVTATVNNAGSNYLIHWMNRGTEFAATITPTVTYTKTPGIDTITARVVPLNQYACYDSSTSTGHVVISTEGVPTVGPTGGPMVYPNPASDMLCVEVPAAWNGAVNYRLMNMVGTVVMRGALNSGGNSVPVHELVRGVYVLEVDLTPALSTGGAGAEKRTVCRVVKE